MQWCGKGFKIKKCKYCDELLECSFLSSIHDFYKKYEEGKTQTVDEKSIVQEIIESIKIFKILLDEHSNKYYFLI